MRWVGFALCWFGCDTTPVDRFSGPLPTTAESVQFTPKDTVVRTTEAAEVVEASKGQPVQIVFVWEGVANLHKGFFSEPDFVDQLGRDLAGHV